VIAAVASRKGGVGKTTLSVNLAAALARRGRRVLLVDLDSQASASLSLGVPRLDLAPSAYDLIRGKAKLAEVIRSTSTHNLSLITASADLADLDRTPPARGNMETQLRTVLRPALTDFDHILLDCPPWPNAASVNAIAAADYLLIPVVPQFLAVEGVENLLNAADRLRDKLGYGARPLGLVVSMADYRAKLARKTVEALRASQGSLVFAIEVRTNTRLAEAPGYGKTIFEHDAASTGARCFDLLADEYLLRAGDPDQLPIHFPTETVELAHA
jgi:chromosome partitioning protein